MTSGGVIRELARVRGHGGRRLLVHRFVPPAGRARRGSVLWLHGIQSHAEWYADTARHLAEQGFECALPERRGSGRDGRARGDAPSLQALVDDTRSVASWLAEESGSVPAWVGVSWGGKLALHGARRLPGLVAGLVLVCPGLLPRIDLRRRDKLAVAGGLLAGGLQRLPIPLADPALFTALPEFQRYVRDDPLSLRTATARFFAVTRALDVANARNDEPLPASLPVLLVVAPDDPIIDTPKTIQLLRRLAPRLEIHECARARHTPEFSEDAPAYRARLASFCAAIPRVPA